MLRILIVTLFCAILCSCSNKKSLQVYLHVDGAEVSQESFENYQDAAEWVSESCHKFWEQAKAKGSSQVFHVEASGLNLAGKAYIPNFQFERFGQNGMRLVQLDEDSEPSPKIEGSSLDWKSAQRYISDELIMNRLFITANQK